MIIISAMAKNNRVIGTADGLPWHHLPDEYAHYLKVTSSHPVIMGRKTYDILTQKRGREYEVKPDSKMYIVSKSLESGSLPDAEVCGNLIEAMDRARNIDDVFFCAGGVSLYQQSLDGGLADTMYLSEIEGDYEGTAYFPKFDKSAWKETNREHHKGWDFVVYENKK